MRCSAFILYIARPVEHKQRENKAHSQPTTLACPHTSPIYDGPSDTHTTIECSSFMISALGAGAVRRFGRICMKRVATAVHSMQYTTCIMRPGPPYTRLEREDSYLQLLDLVLLSLARCTRTALPGFHTHSSCSPLFTRFFVTRFQHAQACAA